MKSFVLPIVILLLGGFTASFFYKKHEEQSLRNSLLIKEIDFDKGRLKASHELKALEFKNQGKKLNLDIQCRDINNLTETLNKLVKNNVKLIFCIPESVCNPCHEMTFRQLTKIVDKVDKDNVIVLVDSPRLRATVAEFNDRKSNLKVLGVDYKQFGVDIHYVPFMFILSKNAFYENLFVPNSFDPKLTQDYIENINNRYFKTTLM